MLSTSQRAARMGPQLAHTAFLLRRPPSPSFSSHPSLFTLTFWEAFPEALLQPSKRAHCLCMRSPFPSAFAHGPVLLPMGSSSQVEIMAMLCLFLFSELFGSSSSECINLYMVYLILLYHFLLAKYCDNYPIDYFFNWIHLANKKKKTQEKSLRWSRTVFDQCL